jgi:hypothetical protein
MRLLLILILFLAPLLSSAAVFTSAEVTALMSAGRLSVVQSTQAHHSHLAKTGIGLYYGALSPYSPLGKKNLPTTAWTDLERFGYIKSKFKKDFVQQLGSIEAVDSYAQSLLGTQDLIPRTGDLKMTSSLFWALKHVRAAYMAVGKKERADQIFRYVIGQGGLPHLLLAELQKDGWEAIYWNPDTQSNEPNDKHNRSYQEAKNGYYNNSSLVIHHMMIDYRLSKNSNTKKNSPKLARLNRIPFWIGLANYGQQLFVGYQGRISEIHNFEMPTSKMLIKDSLFAQWTGYTNEKYLSGVIVVPPHSW